MDARSLIETLRNRGLSLRLEGDRIKVEAPQEPDPETKALLSKLRQLREEAKEALGEFQPDEVDRIVKVWREILGIKLDRAKVKEHLEGLRKWQTEWETRRGG